MTLSSFSIPFAATLSGAEGGFSWHLGFSIFSPVEKVAKSVKPASIPIAVSDVNEAGAGTGSPSSTRMLTNHFPGGGD